MSPGAMVLCSWGPTLTAADVKQRMRTEQHGSRRRGPSSVNLGYSLAVSAAKNSVYFFGCQSLIHVAQGGSKKSFAACNSVDPSGVPLPSGPPSDSWKWILGIVMTFVIPFFWSRWGPLLKIKNEVEAAVQTVENVVDGVEKVAENVEKIAEDIAEELPAGGLKNAVLRIEKVADQIDDKAELIGDLIDKVQEVEERVDSALGSAVEAEEALKKVEAKVEN